jgi:hypothetical protein
MEVGGLSLLLLLPTLVFSLRPRAERPSLAPGRLASLERVPPTAEHPIAPLPSSSSSIFRSSMRMRGLQDPSTTPTTSAAQFCRNSPLAWPLRTSRAPPPPPPPTDAESGSGRGRGTVPGGRST